MIYLDRKEGTCYVSLPLSLKDPVVLFLDLLEPFPLAELLLLDFLLSILTSLSSGVCEQADPIFVNFIKK